MNALDLAHPYWLLLLPLTLLPWAPRRRDAIAYPSIAWMPEDRWGPVIHLVWQALAAITLLCLIIALAGPGKSGTQLERIGRGAELSIVLDRSASMDANIRRPLPGPGDQARPSETKNEVVRSALNWLVEQRPQNRYALTVFSVAPVRVSPFSDDAALVQAGIRASGIGRGPNKTNMGLALLSAIQQFDSRPYTGSRAIVLVSDGGAKLDARIRTLISDGLIRNRINLYFIYIPSSPNSPDLQTVGTQSADAVDEIALHLFFKQLDTEYRVFQANDRESLGAVVAEIDQQQNLPLTYLESLPRVDYSHWFYRAALASCLLLCVLSALTLERNR